MARVFLSYRREDSRADTGRLFDRLSRHFGDANVFMDIDDIDAGENFVEKLTRTLAQCEVLLLVIGPRWLSAADEEGRPRLAAPGDFVRLEAQTALERGIPLIPVLVGGARMPERGDLPSQLAGIVVHQALSVSDERFHGDVDRLIAAIEQRIARDRAWWARPAPWLALAAIAALVAGGFVLRHAWHGAAPEPLRTAPATLASGEVTAFLAARDYYDAQHNAGGRGPPHAFEVVLAEKEALIVDRATGLMWQKRGSGRPIGYEEAVRAVATLNAERYAGYADWRLPTLEEAMSLMEPAKTASGYHLDVVFDAGSAPILWTADAGEGGRRWLVYYYDGVAAQEPANFGAQVRAVRTADR
jgi:hypothetical protein